MAFTAFFDACVFYPAPLRDLLLRLAVTGLFRARWSADVQDEWIRNLVKRRPELADKLVYTRAMMETALPGAEVAGYRSLIPGLSLPDKDDRHVLAAAIVSRADVIVTMNLKHFPEADLVDYGIEPQHPDVFIRHVLDVDQAVALDAVKRHRESLRQPSMTADEYLNMLARQGLGETEIYLRRWSALL